MISPNDVPAALEARRAEFLGRIGNPSERVVARLHPIGGAPWPASVLGRMRVVRRRRSRLLVTDGLSCPFDRELYADPPELPLDYELGVDVADLDPLAVSDQGLADSWFPPLLYSLADWMLPEEFDLRGLLERFRAVVVSVPATTAQTRELADASGEVGVLVGLPLVGADLDRHPYVHGYYAGCDPAYADASLGYFPVKPLTVDEFEWSRSKGDEGPSLLAEKFLKRGDAHLVWTGRPSVLARPRLS